MVFQDMEKVQIIAAERKARFDDGLEEPMENLCVIEEGVPGVQIGEGGRKCRAGEREGNIYRQVSSAFKKSNLVGSAHQVATEQAWLGCVNEKKGI